MLSRGKSLTNSLRKGLTLNYRPFDYGDSRIGQQGLIRLMSDDNADLFGGIKKNNFTKNILLSGYRV